MQCKQANESKTEKNGKSTNEGNPLDRKRLTHPSSETENPASHRQSSLLLVVCLFLSSPLQFFGVD